MKRKAIRLAGGYAIVLVTVPDLKTARRVAKAALQARLAACVNLVPRLESHYWWLGKLESSTEILLLLKTRSTTLSRLEAFIMAEHPYETPEFLVVSVRSGNKKYLAWLAENCR
jgi:periplasmic divalent cation tolerance protein